MVTFSPDGERILSIAANVVEIWNVDQAKPIPTQTEVAKKSAASRNQGRITISGSAGALRGIRKFQEEQAAKQGITLPPGDGPVVVEDGQMRSVPLPRNRPRPNGGPMNNGQGGPGGPRPGVGRPGGPGGSGDSPVNLAERGNWAEAAAGYARLFGRTKLNNGEPGFEYAAVTLLSGDVAAYRKICEDLVERSGTQQIRPFHVARACTLAPNSVKDLAALEEKANTELKRSNAHWSLTQQGALAYRAGRFDEAADLFERSVKSDNLPGIAILNWLWLSMIETRRGNPQEARTWYDKASNWMDQTSNGTAAYRQNVNRDVDGLHLHNWLEALILRREAKMLIGPSPARAVGETEAWVLLTSNKHRLEITGECHLRLRRRPAQSFADHLIEPAA
jgi:hypothetical protein